MSLLARAPSSADVGVVGVILLRVDAVVPVVVVNHNHNYPAPFYGEMVQIPTRWEYKTQINIVQRSCQTLCWASRTVILSGVVR